MTNTSKKLLAGLLVATAPIWILPMMMAAFLFIVISTMYLSMCDMLGVKRNEK